MLPRLTIPTILTTTGTNDKIQIKEIALRSKAHRFVRFVPQRSSSLADPSVGWLFCATLRDGSKFAIDVCNAQYTVNTSEDANCGVFPWEQYMTRLSVSHGDLVSEQDLGFCLNTPYSADPTGTARAVEAGILTLEDEQCVAEIFASSVTTVSPMVLSFKHDGLTLTKLLDLPASGHEEGVVIFKAGHQQCLDHARGSLDRGDAQWMLLERFRAGAWIGP